MTTGGVIALPHKPKQFQSSFSLLDERIWQTPIFALTIAMKETNAQANDWFLPFTGCASVATVEHACRAVIAFVRERRQWHMLSEAQIEETKWTDKEDGASPKDNLLNNKPICFCIWIRASVWHELDVVGDGLKKEINESNALRIVIFYLVAAADGTIPSSSHAAVFIYLELLLLRHCGILHRQFPFPNELIITSKQRDSKNKQCCKVQYTTYSTCAGFAVNKYHQELNHAWK